jgi:16S rRNA (uracil1498-N3)-methyltransferase
LAERIATRLYIPASLAEGGTVELDAARAHRLRNVLRLEPGHTVAVFNACDGEFLGRLVESGRDRVTLVIEARLRASEAESDLRLVFAPIKRLRIDWLIEKATELGVDAFTPVLTARTQAERFNRERLVAHAVAAAEQCGRLSVPELGPLVRLDQVLADWQPARHLIVCDETRDGAPIVEVLRRVEPSSPVAILIGPEGGFIQRELDALGNLPFVSRVGLGPRVLRAETAALAALAAFQAIAGDWRGTASR